MGFEGGGASFAQKCFGLTEDAGCDWIGTVVLPGGAPSSRGADATSTTGGLGDSLDPADPLNSACNIFLKRGSGEGSGSEAENNSNGSVSNGGDRSSGRTAEAAGGDDSGVCSTPSPAPSSTTKEEDHGAVVVLCGYRVPPRQADAWAKALLGAIDAEVVVALSTVAAEPGRSEGWQGARLVATAEAEEREDCLKVRAECCLLLSSSFFSSFLSKNGGVCFVFTFVSVVHLGVDAGLTAVSSFFVGLTTTKRAPMFGM